MLLEYEYEIVVSSEEDLEEAINNIAKILKEKYSHIKNVTKIYDIELKEDIYIITAYYNESKKYRLLVTNVYADGKIACKIVNLVCLNYFVEKTNRNDKDK